MTNDQWAVNRNYANFTAYTAAKDFPGATTLTQFRDRAYAIIKVAAGNVELSGDNYLMDLEYRMVELMIDEEDQRRNNKPRPPYMPRDYMFERDRNTVAGMAAKPRRGLVF